MEMFGEALEKEFKDRDKLIDKNFIENIECIRTWGLVYLPDSTVILIDTDDLVAYIYDCLLDNDIEAIKNIFENDMKKLKEDTENLFDNIIGDKLLPNIDLISNNKLSKKLTEVIIDITTCPDIDSKTIDTILNDINTLNKLRCLIAIIDVGLNKKQIQYIEE